MIISHHRGISVYQCKFVTLYNMKTLPKHPWTIGPDNLSEALETNLKKGLTDAEAQNRLKMFGQNVFKKEKKNTALDIFFRQFINPLIIILLIAVLLTVFLAEWLDATVIGFAIIVNAILGFVQEYKAERAIADLRSYISERTRVIRDGKEYEIDAKLLVPGDIIHIMQGVRITADARIITETNFSADESLLTGESLPEAKSVDSIPETATLADHTNMIYAGTPAIGGSAYAMVTATGNDTQIGKLARLVSETVSEKTPLQIALSKLTWIIIVVISIVVILIFIIGIMEGQPFYEMILLSIAIIVGAIPESLPIGLTAVLAVGVEQIAKRKGIMRNLTAAETLGSTTLIITDKTGTLTQAKMQLTDITSLSDLTNKPVSLKQRDNYTDEQKELLLLALSNTDTITKNGDDKVEDWIISGSALDTNVVRSAAKHGLKLSQADKAETQIIIPFNSKHKFSVMKISSKFLPKHLSKYENPHVVLGAPDILLNRAHMDKADYLKATEAIETLSQHGRRVLGIALMTPKTSKKDLGQEDVQDISFIGVLSFYDPIRPEVTKSLELIHSYGVEVVMATGDLPGTALAVAKELGWNVDEQSILTGAQLKQLSDEDLTESLSYVRIFARVTPEDKLRITKLFQARGEIVAMTGDGVNDAPSLKVANIGIAVGSGSDVAKGVSDLVLLDDNFQTIVAAIEEGKRMLLNIKKIFVYLMSNSFDEVILIGGAIIAGIAMPLTAIQIIWVNLFTGSIPAIAYAFDKQAIPKGSHHSRSFFDRPVKFLTLSIGLITSFLLLALYSVLLSYDIPLETAQNIIFICFGTYVLLIAFSIRNLNLPIYKYSLTENKILLFGVLGGLVLMVATMYVPFLQDIVGTSAISLPWLGFVVLWLFVNIIIVEGLKWVSYTYLKDT